MSPFGGFEFRVLSFPFRSILDASIKSQNRPICHFDCREKSCVFRMLHRGKLEVKSLFFNIAHHESHHKNLISINSMIKFDPNSPYAIPEENRFVFFNEEMNL